MARQLGDQPVLELAHRLRASVGGRFYAPGMPPAVALGEVLVHACDAFRPLGLDIEVSPATVVPALDAYRRVGPLTFRTAPQRRARLTATDTAWSAGRGPEAVGRAIDLLLLLAGRRQVLDALDGPGAMVLRS